MPSSQFYLEVQNSMISSLDASTSVATALELGDTEIKLIDKSILALEIYEYTIFVYQSLPFRNHAFIRWLLRSILIPYPANMFCHENVVCTLICCIYKGAI